MPTLDSTLSGLQTLLTRAERLHQDHRPHGLGHTRDLLRAVEKLKTMQIEVSQDRNLSEVGKRERMAETTKRLIDLSVLKKVRERTAADMQRLKTELFTLPARRDGMDGFIERLDEQEIRLAVTGKNQGEIITMFRDALAAGNHTAVRALSRGPLGSLLPGDIEGRLWHEHASRTKPEQFGRLESLGALDEHLAAVEAFGSGVLRELTGHDGKG